MQYLFSPMREQFADEIIFHWHYDGIYSFYDMTADEEDLKIFTNIEYWKDTIFAVLDENGELVGWSSFYIENEDVWISLGLKPQLTGRGLGKEFVSECVKFAKSHYKLDEQTIKLDVALFNQRAIKVYKKAGFCNSKKIIKNTHIGEVDFLRMEKTLIN